MPQFDKETLNRVVMAFRLTDRSKLKAAGVDEPRSLGTAVNALISQVRGEPAPAKFQAWQANYKPAELFHALDRTLAEIGPIDNPLAELLRRRQGEIAVESMRTSKEFFAAEWAA